MPAGTLSHWRWRLRAQAQATPTVSLDIVAATPTFVPVPVTPAPSAPAPRGPARYEIVCAAGRVLRVGDDFEPATLQRLLRVL